jgi:hypothetical protein
MLTRITAGRAALRKSPTFERPLTKLPPFAEISLARVAEEYLSKLTVDEASVEKVVRDAPM